MNPITSRFLASRGITFKQGKWLVTPIRERADRSARESRPALSQSGAADVQKVAS